MRWFGLAIAFLAGIVCIQAIKSYHLKSHVRRRPILKMDETLEIDSWEKMDKIQVPEGLYEMAGEPKKSSKNEDPYRRVFKEKMEKLSKQLASERRREKQLKNNPYYNLRKSLKLKEEPSFWEAVEESGEKEEEPEDSLEDFLAKIEKMDKIPSVFQDRESDEEDSNSVLDSSELLWDPRKIFDDIKDVKKHIDESDEEYDEDLDDSFGDTEEEYSEEVVEKPRNVRKEKSLPKGVKLLPKRYGYYEDLARPHLKRPCAWKPEKVYEHKTAPRSWEYPGFEATIPREWDWRNVSGVNYCSPTRNQHIPVYCGSCWVFGTLGMLNDRFNVARKGRWPYTFLSPQEVINCNGQGNCSGGTPGFVFEHGRIHGLVEEGCNNYKAINEKCSPYNRCGTCWPGNCYAIQNYTRFYVKEYGPVSGREAMMAEIHNRGPIACTIGGTARFDFNYTSGIYDELADEPFNHNVAVTGWGVDPETNVEYWIVRNSWGEAWGEKGWFRIVTSLYKNGRGDEYNMGIERECFWADVDVSNLD